MLFVREQCERLLHHLTEQTLERVQTLVQQEKIPYGTSDPARLQRRADAYRLKLEKEDRVTF